MFCSVCVLFNWLCFSSRSCRSEQLFSEELIWGGFSPLAPPYSGLGFTITFLQLYSEFLCRQWSTSRDPHGVYLSHEALKKKPVFLFWFFFFYLLLFSSVAFIKYMKSGQTFIKECCDILFWWILCEADVSENCLKEMKDRKAVIHKNIKVRFISFWFIL